MPDEPNQDQQKQGSETPPEPTTWADYVAAHPEAAPLYEAETANMKKALDAERDRAKAAEKALRDMAKTATDPAQAEALKRQADEMKADADATRAQLDFYAEAARLGCKALDKAWVVARATELNAEQMKADPDWGHLFAAARPADAKGGAGASGGKPVSDNERINQGIRAAAGRVVA